MLWLLLVASIPYSLWVLLAVTDYERYQQEKRRKDAEEAKEKRRKDAEEAQRQREVEAERKDAGFPPMYPEARRVGNTGYRRYLKTISDQHFAIDPDKIAEDNKFDGIFVLRTNTDLNPLEAMLCYKQLWTVDIYQAWRLSRFCCGGWGGRHRASRRQSSPRHRRCAHRLQGGNYSFVGVDEFNVTGADFDKAAA